MLIEPPTSSRRALVTGLPLSSASISANSSACFSRRSPRFHTSLERSAGEIRDHGPVSNALRAAFTARSISASSPAGTCAMISCVAGSSTSKVLPLLAATHFAVDQHVMLLGQKRLRVFAKLRFGDGDIHDILPDGAGGFRADWDRYIPKNIPRRGLRPAGRRPP